MRPIRLLFVVGALLPLAGCMAPVPAPAVSGSSVGASAPVAAAPTADLVHEVERLVNEHRARVGCGPLAWDETAARVAQGHSDDMARRGYFSHVSPEGRTPADRLHAAGGTFRALAGNIAQGPRTAQEVVRGWLDSPGHRHNIENCTYTRDGVGLRNGLWTHFFYTPL